MPNHCQLVEFITCDLIRISERYYSVPRKSLKHFLNLVAERQFLLEELLVSEQLAVYRVGKTTLEKAQ